MTKPKKLYRIKSSPGESPIVGIYTIIRKSRLTGSLTIRRQDGPYAGSTYVVAPYELEEMGEAFERSNGTWDVTKVHS